MTTVKTKELPAKVPSQLDTDLTLMGLHFMAEHHSDLANRAVRDSLGKRQEIIIHSFQPEPGHESFLLRPDRS